MLLLVGLGLHAPGSIGVEALEALEHADTVYLEVYTNLGITPQELAEFLKRPVLPAPRSTVENEALIRDAAQKTVALCVIGDIFTATTHSVLYLDCLEKDIAVRLFPNAGIMNTIAFTGLELYKFGQTVSLVFPSEQYSPTSWAEKIESNRAAGLHTLCLLDIRADEGRYMTIPEAVPLLEKHVHSIKMLIGVAKLGTENHIFAGTPEALIAHHWPSQPHSIVIPGILNAVEQEFLERWSR